MSTKSANTDSHSPNISEHVSERALIVLGMHRSGSSVLTRIINLHGGKLLGDLTKPNRYNERGYWENPTTHLINDEILGFQRSAWFDWHSYSLDSLPPNKRNYFENKIVRFLSDEIDFGNTPLFVIKDPRICKIFPIWQNALRTIGAKVSIIIPFRHPNEVAASLAHRDHLPRNWSLLLWLRYMLDIERFSRGHSRVFLSDDKLLLDWQSAFQNMERLLQLKWPIASTSISSEVEAFLSPDLKHHHWTSSDLDLTDSLGRRTHNLYMILKEMELKKEVKSLQTTFDVANDELTHLSEPIEENLPLAIKAQLAFEKKKQLIDEQEREDRKIFLALRTSGSNHVTNLFALKDKIETISSKLSKKEEAVAMLNEKTEELARKLDQLTKLQASMVIHGLEKKEKLISWASHSTRTLTVKFRNVTQHIRNKRKANLIDESEYFDPEWYLSQYPDVRDEGMNPALHYVTHGAKEGRNPGPDFNGSAYLRANPDLALENINPLEHYIKHGQAEGRTTISPERSHLAKIGFSSPIHDHGLYFQIYEGKQKEQKNRPTILACAHVAGKHIFGGERSFLDLIEALQSAEFNVISTIPNDQNQPYIDQIAHFSNQVITFSYKWWTKDLPPNEFNITVFEHMIRFFGIDAVHSNTIMLREPLIAAKRQGIVAVMHVREIIEYDEALTKHIGKDPEKIRQHILSITDFFVANSRATSQALQAPSKTFVVENCADIEQFECLPREPSDTLNVALISSNIPKKGIYDFVEVLQKLSPTHPKLRFLMVGPINAHIRALQGRQARAGISKSLQFPGYFTDPAAAFQLADIVVNLSRFQESFGRTVLEAMLAGKPVIAYDWGALNELVQHGKTGYLAPFGDIDAVAGFISNLAEKPELRSQMGETAKEIATVKYSKQAYTTKIKNVYAKILDARVNKAESRQEQDSETRNIQSRGIRVSVIIPNYNYAQFLDERIKSILNQTVTPFEILFLDDYSTDSSVQLAINVLAKSGVKYKIYQNSENQGTYKQWLKGIQEASGDYIWIAEADDSCEPDFLERLLNSMPDHRTVLAYCQSLVLDERGSVIHSRNLHHTNAVSETHWLSDYRESGTREVVDHLVYRNTIPNVSACLFRSHALKDAIDDIDSYRFCGDWSLYCRLLQTGDIAFIADPLNHFRRHSDCVTRKQGRSKDYLRELLRIKQQQLEAFPVHPRQLPEIRHFLDTDYKIDGLNRNSDWEESESLFSLYEQKIAHRRRYVLLTTNNGSFSGGSEMLWVESAMRLRAQGHDVMVIIKDWSPQPPFLDDFQQLGIRILFKDGHEINAIRSFIPDLIVVSTGDQDEGTEYFKIFIEENRPYVIVNQLTKQTEYWPLIESKLLAVSAAYEQAVRIFFTCWNNHKVMESRLGHSITNAELHYNPFHINRDIDLPFPNFDEGVKMAVPAKLLHIHKGQKTIIELMSFETWKERDITISFYGEGPDEEEFKALVAAKGLDNIKFFPKVSDLLTIWRENHIILMPSFMEGLPIVLVGAMLCGRVPIVTDIGGHAEVVEDNVSGFIALKPTIEDLDNALSRAMSCIDELEKIGRKARQSILDFLPADPVEDFLRKLDACCSDTEVLHGQNEVVST